MVGQAQRASDQPANAGPIRTCVACRTREPDSQLLRFVYDGGSASVVPDYRRQLPGRGAWVHPTKRCMMAALGRRAFTRALRVDGTASTDAVTAAIDALRVDREQHSEKNGPDTMSTP